VITFLWLRPVLVYTLFCLVLIDRYFSVTRQSTVLDLIMFCKDLFLILRPVIVGLYLFVYFLLNLSLIFCSRSLVIIISC